MKTKVNDIVEEMVDDFNQFLKSGKFYDLSSFTKAIDTNLNIDNIEKLLRIHFILTEKDSGNKYGVIDFVKNLSRRIRRIKTTIKKDSEIFKGNVKGRINWNETIKLRYKNYPNNNTFFVCDRREKNYEISENLVLKKLLQIIYSIVNQDLNFVFTSKEKIEYEWLKDWVEKKGLRDFLNKIFLKNVYLKKIKLEDIKITERMINRAKRSRNKLYQEAAFLLSRYFKLMNYDINQDEVKELLSNTFIIPEKTEVLFELYWIIRIIRQFQEATFYLLSIDESHKNLVASWEDNECKYKIFHNSIGSFSFREDVSDLLDELKEKEKHFGRMLKVHEKMEEMVKTKKLWQRRPDIILEKYDKEDNLISILIGEVKYTTFKNYAIQGLRELLEYVALIKKDDIYLEGFNNLFKSLESVKGVLFLDIISDFNVLDDENIQIIMFGEDKTVKVS